MRKTVPAALLAATAVIALAACASSGTPASNAGAATSSRPAAASPANNPAQSNPASSSAQDGTKTYVRVNQVAPGTKAICAALAQNSYLAALTGVASPSSLKFASGTVTNSAFGLTNVPGCQIGIDLTSQHVVVAWGMCHYADPQGLSDNGPIWGTRDVYTLSAAANGVFIVLGPTTAVAMLTGTAGSRSEAVLLPAIRTAAALFTANGGCSSQ